MLYTSHRGPDKVFVNAAGIIAMTGKPSLNRGITAIAVHDGRIAALGDDDAMRALAGSAPVIDLEGAVVMPGLVDSHNHFLSTAMGWERVQLAHTRSIDELVAAVEVRARETPPGEWVLCSSRWHETNLAEGRMPTAEELDRVTPNHPVHLPRGGHVVVTNSRGLALAGIAHGTSDPPGGEYVRDASGKLTGMLLERPAFAALNRLLPQPDDEDRRRALRAGIAAYNRAGITTVRDPGLNATEIKAYRAVLPEAQSLRASLMWRIEMRMAPEERRAWIDDRAGLSEFGDDWLDVWGLKIGLDGGVEGGYFRDPYANNAEFRGFPFYSKEDLHAILEQAHGLGWRVGVHVVGDAAMDMVLEAFERLDASTGAGAGGHALEHAFSPAANAVERTRDLGLGVTLQHALVYSLAGNMRTYWGDQRAADCTPARAWLDSKVVVGAGTDSPVTNYDPWQNIYGFATRDTDVAGVLGPEHRISVAETLQAYTVGSATVLRMDDTIGSLAPGKAADFIGLDRDPLSVPVSEVRHTAVKRTIVGGEQVFEA